MTSFGSSSQQWVLLSSIFLILCLFTPGVFNGFACLNNPCVHGVCVDDLNSTYFCYCIDGYTGIQCQTNWNECWSSPCRNGGICLDGIAMFNCSCPPGYAGELCEEDINECDSNPCFNNGTCLDVHNGYTCSCLPGYSGVHCEIDVAVCNATNETRCANGGICEEGPGETFTCYCQPGWGGFLCESDVDECFSAPCQNGAVCIDLHADYSCACLFGFTGRNCEEAIQICDTNPCKNAALCLLEEGRAVCYCVPDFHGEQCQFQYDECQLGPRCMNGGTCIDGIDNFTCSCPQNLTGVLCECLILGDNKLDCNYVSPSNVTTTTVNYDNVTIKSTLPTFVPSTVTASIPFETTEVPTTEVVIRTDATDFLNGSSDSTVTIFSVSSEMYTPYTSTEISTIYSTDTAVFEEVSSESAISTISVPISSTDLVVITTKEPTTTTELTTEGFSSTTESPTTIPTTELTTEFPLTSTEPQYTTQNDTKTSQSYQSETFSTSTETIEHTTHPNITIDVTTYSSTQLTDTTLLEETTTPYTTTTREKETNRTFPEEVTTYTPSISTFLTTEPTRKMESSTLTTTDLTTFETTSSIPTEQTTLPSIDCTKFESRCQNGGTCIYMVHGYKCACPFDTEGRFCELKLGVRNAAFNEGSYLAHRLLNTSHIVVEFEARTMADSGILFYSNIDTTYMALYMQDGFLKFKFSCGYQTMLLSELKVPVNNGYTMNIKAQLEFSKDFKHCDASIKVNDSLSMTGDQIAKVDQLQKPLSWLYLGGLPQEFSNEIIPVSGFIGCMSGLKISNKKINIYKDAEDGVDITECSSLACLSNPCKNGASCTSVDDSWQCHCRNGYLGSTCDVSICDNNPCLFGATCIPFTNSGYICLCPYGKHGHFCEDDLKITEPYFSSTVRGLSSYVAYPIPDGGVSKHMELKFRFTPTTMEQISLLLFMGQTGHHDFYSDHLAVSFVKGYIMLTWNLGSGPRRIFTSKPIKSGDRDYLVRLGHFGRRAWLYVEGLGNVTGRSPGNLAKLDTTPLIFIGGHHSKNFSALPHDLPLHSGFSGCIFDIEMKSGSVLIPIQGNRQTFGRAVGQCGTSECYEQSCQNNGACLHHGSTFMCLCQDNWYGPLCSSKNNLCDMDFSRCDKKSTCVPLLSNYECDCPIGKTGQYCDKDENTTDVSLTGKRSFIALQPIEMETSKFQIEVEIRILNDQGVLMFIGKTTSGFVCLSLLNGLLELRLHPGKTKATAAVPIIVRSSKLLVKGIWNKIKFGLFGRKLYLSVDNVVNTGVLDEGQMVSISSDNIFIGGLPDMSEFPLTASGGLPVHYTGCIRHLSIDEKHIPLTFENIKSARNMDNCDGTACGGEACLNGGTCWLDSFMKPHCSCVSPYYGDRCEIVPECDEKLCKNQGKCYNGRCSCNIGWGGAFCEKEITVKTPEFVGRSYLVVEKIREKKRDLRDMELVKIYLNFTTVKRDSLLVWSKKGANFIGLGIEKGLLKLTYSSAKINKTIVEVPFYYPLSDGLWHNLEISFVPFLLKLDQKLLEMQKRKDSLLDNTISTDGVFYIGGLPTNTSLMEETNGLFPYAFEGCIEGFGTNTDIVRDFSQYEGVNVHMCELF